MKKHAQPPLIVHGLTDRESRIWHALSMDSFLNVSQLAKHTGLHRPAVYQHLSTLMEKGLVTKDESSARALYRTTGPKPLEKFRAEHDRQFAKHLSSMKPINAIPPLIDIRVYHGKEIQQVWNEVLASPKGTVFYRYDAYAPSLEVASFMPAGFYETMEQKKMERFVITNTRLRMSPYKKRIECASRMLPKSWNAFEQGVTQFIFGDTVAVIDFNAETAYVISNPAIAAFQREMFRGLFRLLKE